MVTFKYQGPLWDDCRPKSKPAIACLDGALIVIFRGHDDSMWVWWLNRSAVMRKFKFEGTLGAPSLAVYLGELHIVIREDSGRLVYHQWHHDGPSDEPVGHWGSKILLGEYSNGPVSLVEYAGQMFCAYNSTEGNKLKVQKFDSKGWHAAKKLDDHWTYGEPSLYVVDNALRMLYISADNSRTMNDLVYDQNNDVWAKRTPPRESSRYGLSAVGTNSLGRAFVAFQYDNDDGSFGVAEYSGGSWDTNIPQGYFSAYTPVLAAYGKRVYMVWDRRADGMLYWADGWIR